MLPGRRSNIRLPLSLLSWGLLATLGAGYAYRWGRDQHRQLSQIEQSRDELKEQLAGAATAVSDLQFALTTKNSINLDQEPAFAKSRRTRLMHTIERQYGRGFTVLALDPGQIAKTKELFYTRLKAIEDARAAAYRQNLTLAATNEAAQAAGAEVDREIIALIGAPQLKILEGYKNRWIERSTREGFRRFIDMEIGEDLRLAGHPLTSEVTDAIGDAFYDAGHGDRPKLQSTGEIDPKTGLSAFYQRVYDRTVALLSPEQQTRYKLFLCEEAEQSLALVHFAADHRKQMEAKDQQATAAQVQREIIRRGMSAALPLAQPASK